MQTINLKQYYPFCKEDICVEVSDEIVEAFLLDKRAEAARDRKMFRYKAFYSLDCNDGIDNAFHLFRSLKVSVLPSFSHLLLLASDADVGHQLLHIPGLVIELALEAGERQPSGIAESLQGTRRDVKAQADILAVQSLSGFLTAVCCKERRKLISLLAVD